MLIQDNTVLESKPHLFGEQIALLPRIFPTTGPLPPHPPLNHLRACAVRVRVVHRDDLSVVRGLRIAA